MDANDAMLAAALLQRDVYPKALAAFMFREIMEDAHAKYNISQEDMKEMCKEAVNRAAVFLAIKDDPKLYKAFGLYAAHGTEWDDAEITEELLDTMAMLADTYERMMPDRKREK